MFNGYGHNTPQIDGDSQFTGNKSGNDRIANGGIFSQNPIDEPSDIAREGSPQIPNPRSSSMGNPFVNNRRIPAYRSTLSTSTNNQQIQEPTIQQNAPNYQQNHNFVAGSHKFPVYAPTTAPAPPNVQQFAPQSAYEQPYEEQNYDNAQVYGQDYEQNYQDYDNLAYEQQNYNQSPQSYPPQEQDYSFNEQSNSWSEGFDDFDSFPHQRQQWGLEKRNIEKIFTEEQLRLYDNNRFTELHYSLQVDLTKDPRNLRALIGVALCNLSIGEPQKSADYFAKATDIDESTRPSLYLQEVPACDPDDWLDMAEELGHYGMIDGAMQLCSSIVESNQFSDRIRRQAMKVREVIKQDYFAARDRIIVGNNRRNASTGMGPSKLLNAVLFIIVPLLFAALLGSIMFYSINMNNGLKHLSSGIYRLERLKKGDTAVERMGTCDNDLADADSCFVSAMKFNPFTKEAYFYDMQVALLFRELGKVRRNDENKKWDRDRWAEVKSNLLDAEDAYKSLNISEEQNLAFRKEWQEFYKKSQSDENASF